MSDAVAGRYFNTVTNVWESALGFTGAPRAQLWAWQPSSLSLQPLTLDALGTLNVNGVGGGGGSNAAAGPTGAAVPVAAGYTGFNLAGNLVGVSSANPFPVTVIAGGGGGTQYADGVTQATPTGTVALGKNASNILHALSLDASGNLNVLLANASIAVTGTFWQATQPVSGNVGITGSVAVTGAFFQATQPISGTVAATQSGTWTTQITDGTNTATVKAASTAAVAADKALVVAISPNNSVAVTGTFWQGTQPVSIAGSVAVTGTFWQATQPVSGNVGITGSVAVTGAFFQATQPVSIAATVTVGGTVTVSNFPGTQPVSGTVTATTAPSTATGNAPAVVTVGVASGAAVATNASRKGLVLVNLSTGNISLAFNGAAAVLGSGITLVPNGTFSMDAFSFTTGAVAAIAALAASPLAVQEWQ